MSLNLRFAQPGRYPQTHADHLYPSDQFPFAYASTTDHHTGRTDAILKRPQTDPKVIHTASSAEYWERRDSLVHTDTRGQQDLPEPPNLRRYHYAAAQHSVDARQEFPEKEGYGRKAGIGAGGTAGTLHLANILNTNPLNRSLLTVLAEWVCDGKEPPASSVPSIREGTLKTPQEVGALVPRLPEFGAGNQHGPPPGNKLYVQDFGVQDLEREGACGKAATEDLAREYPVLVPTVDADGNDVAGIRMPHVAVPVATYTGWNWRDDVHVSAAALGASFPFAADRKTREQAGDPRPSLQERYGNGGLAGYVRRLAVEAESLVARRLLLPEDADGFVAEGMSGVYKGVKVGEALGEAPPPPPSAKL